MIIVISLGRMNAGSSITAVFPAPVAAVHMTCEGPLRLSSWATITGGCHSHNSKPNMSRANLLIEVIRISVSDGVAMINR